MSQFDNNIIHEDCNMQVNYIFNPENSVIKSFVALDGQLNAVDVRMAAAMYWDKHADELTFHDLICFRSQMIRTMLQLLPSQATRPVAHHLQHALLLLHRIIEPMRLEMMRPEGQYGEYVAEFGQRLFGQLEFVGVVLTDAERYQIIGRWLRITNHPEVSAWLRGCHDNGQPLLVLSFLNLMYLTSAFFAQYELLTGVSKVCLANYIVEHVSTDYKYSTVQAALSRPVPDEVMRVLEQELLNC